MSKTQVAVQSRGPGNTHREGTYLQLGSPTMRMRVLLIISYFIRKLMQLQYSYSTSVKSSQQMYITFVATSYKINNNNRRLVTLALLLPHILQSNTGLQAFIVGCIIYSSGISAPRCQGVAPLQFRHAAICLGSIANRSNLGPVSTYLPNIYTDEISSL